VGEGSEFGRRGVADLILGGALEKGKACLQQALFDVQHPEDASHGTKNVVQYVASSGFPVKGESGKCQKQPAQRRVL
jgi:hypothetical protein